MKNKFFSTNFNEKIPHGWVSLSFDSVEDNPTYFSTWLKEECQIRFKTNSGKEIIEPESGKKLSQFKWWSWEIFPEDKKRILKKKLSLHLYFMVWCRKKSFEDVVVGELLDHKVIFTKDIDKIIRLYKKSKLYFYNEYDKLTSIKKAVYGMRPIFLIYKKKS